MIFERAKEIITTTEYISIKGWFKANGYQEQKELLLRAAKRIMCEMN
ncbi:MAG: hypothetical protein PHX30_03365 [Candidatus Pacebacteria bacterium]|jgi:hypothetical protein|nr:hypothetical protein [Candidatus Paceibacterota bacterium]